MVTKWLAGSSMISHWLLSSEMSKPEPYIHEKGRTRSAYSGPTFQPKSINQRSQFPYLKLTVCGQFWDWTRLPEACSKPLRVQLALLHQKWDKTLRGSNWSLSCKTPCAQSMPDIVGCQCGGSFSLVCPGPMANEGPVSNGRCAGMCSRAAPASCAWTCSQAHHESWKNYQSVAHFFRHESGT